jgi:hypothetical protein
MRQPGRRPAAAARDYLDLINQFSFFLNAALLFFPLFVQILLIQPLG